MAYYDDVVNALRHSCARRATLYLTERLVVKATARNKPRATDRHSEYVLSIGRPNYDERKFIKRAKKAGASFPTEIQIQPWPKNVKKGK